MEQGEEGGVPVLSSPLPLSWARVVEASKPAAPRLGSVRREESAPASGPLRDEDVDLLKEALEKSLAERLAPVVAEAAEDAARRARAEILSRLDEIVEAAVDSELERIISRGR